MQWPKPAFTPAQVKQLRALGLLNEQVNELQRRLSQIKWLLEPRATVTEVRNRFTTIGKPLALARREVSKLAVSKLADGVEARLRLEDASEKEKLLEDALSAISAVEAAIEAAKARLPRQLRSHSASSRPIGLIDQALLDGFVRYHTAPMPPYLMRASRSGVFAEVVSICYQAAGRNGDQDRAIKNYLREKSLRELAGRKRAFAGFMGSLSMDFLTRRKAGRPRGSKNSR